jgi:hypothetical protein
MTMEDRPRRRRSINNDDLKDDGGGDNGMSMGDAGMQQGMSTPGQSGRQRDPSPRPQTNTPPVVKPAVSDVHYEAAGTWKYTIDSPQGGAGTIVLSKDGDTYSGTIKSDRMSSETTLEEVVVQYNHITFSYPVTFGGNTRTIKVDATLVDNDTLTGSLSFGPSRNVPLTGTRAQ